MTHRMMIIVLPPTMKLVCVLPPPIPFIMVTALGDEYRRLENWLVSWRGEGAGASLPPPHQSSSRYSSSTSREPGRTTAAIAIYSKHPPLKLMTRHATSHPPSDRPCPPPPLSPRSRLMDDKYAVEHRKVGVVKGQDRTPLHQPPRTRLPVIHKP